MAGSLAEVATYIGSGSFYSSGYHDPYASLALFLRPTYELGGRFGLRLNARFFVEGELTKPDNPENRHVYVYDPWLWLSATNLHTFERSKIRVAGVARTIWPLSPESRYQHLVVGAGAGLSLNRLFSWFDDLPPEQRWVLTTTWATSLTKYFQTSHFRGSGPSDSSGCRASTHVAAVGRAGGEGPVAGDSDRCGGPANPNLALLNTAVVGVGHGRWTATVTLLLSNTFNYEIPKDSLSSDNAVSTGRSDTTWGIISFDYELSAHLVVSVGLSSQQKALDARNRYPRFPFFDLSGGLNANNYTQLFVGLDGTL